MNSALETTSFLNEANALAQFLDKGTRATKVEARSLRARCLKWLDTAPETLPRNLLPSWGNVVATLVHAEDVLRTGVPSIRKFRAPKILVEWLRWIVSLPSKTLFATFRGVPLLYTSFYRCAIALQHARGYSATLHEALVQEQWNPTPLLRCMILHFDEHRNFRSKSHLTVHGWAETPWLEALLLVFQRTDWKMPNCGPTNSSWSHLTMFTQSLFVPGDSIGQPNALSCWTLEQTEADALIAKLVDCLPDSASEALLFARNNPELFSEKSLRLVFGMDMRKTSAYGGISLWLLVHQDDDKGNRPIREMLAEKFPKMESTLRSYLQMVPHNETMAWVPSLIPAWRQHVVGLAPPPEDIIPGDLFVDALV